jgi:G patch domain and KOW motifs-containing protein
MTSTIKSNDTGLSFSLGSKKKKKKEEEKPKDNHPLVTTTSISSAFHDDDEEEEMINNDNNNNNNYHHHENTDIPKEPLVIPLPKDSRNSLLQERFKNNQNDHYQEKSESEMIMKKNNKSHTLEVVSSEDLAAIEALKQEASSSEEVKKKKYNEISSQTMMVIQKSSDTFQGNSSSNNDAVINRESKEQFQENLTKLPENVSVDSQLYKAVPISEFGAAMLRGMGWTGDDKNDNDNINNRTDITVPRPSRLGLGATPKMLQVTEEDAPATHSGRRRPRCHDQVQREERIKKQQEELEQVRKRQVAMDKQQTMQVGSIVHVVASDDDNARRAKIYKLQGVPGLNMILVLYEKESEPTKVKKGSVTLIERRALLDLPFQEGPVPNTANRQKLNDHTNGEMKCGNNKDARGKRKDDTYQRPKDDKTHKRKDHSPDHYHYAKSKKLQTKNNSSSSSQRRDDHYPSWLIPNIRVRIVSRKYGSQHYKEKGVVIDVTRTGEATLKMDHGQVLHAVERHLETALPKVGGYICILAGNHRLSKGKLIERDSKANRGSVQIFEDLSIVTTSLDDMAEWCGPLDDDLDQPHY